MPNQTKFNAFLTFEEVTHHDNNDFNVMRRMSLLPLTKSQAELEEFLQKDESLYVELFETSANYVGYLRELLSLAEQSVIRMAAAAGLEDDDE